MRNITRIVENTFSEKKKSLHLENTFSSEIIVYYIFHYPQMYALIQMLFPRKTLYQNKV